MVVSGLRGIERYWRAFGARVALHIRSAVAPAPMNERLEGVGTDHADRRIGARVGARDSKQSDLRSLVARARGTPRVVGAPSSRREGRTPEPGSPTVVGAPDRQRWDARPMASLTLTRTAGQAAGSGSWTSRPSPSDGRRRVLAVAKGAPPVPVPGPFSSRATSPTARLDVLGRPGFREAGKLG